MTSYPECIVLLYQYMKHDNYCHITISHECNQLFYWIPFILFHCFLVGSVRDSIG